MYLLGGTLKEIRPGGRKKDWVRFTGIKFFLCQSRECGLRWVLPEVETFTRLVSSIRVKGVQSLTSTRRKLGPITTLLAQVIFYFMIPWFYLVFVYVMYNWRGPVGLKYVNNISLLFNYHNFRTWSTVNLARNFVHRVVWSPLLSPLCSNGPTLITIFSIWSDNDGVEALSHYFQQRHQNHEGNYLQLQFICYWKLIVW